MRTETRGLLSKVKEDVRLLQRQYNSQTVIHKRQTTHPQELQRCKEIWLRQAKIRKKIAATPSTTQGRHDFSKSRNDWGVLRD
jgi:hypothetical protein